MTKKKDIIEPIDAEFDDLAETVMKRTTDEAISSFVKITQEDMREEANQPDDMLKSVSAGEFRLVPFRQKKYVLFFMKILGGFL